MGISRETDGGAGSEARLKGDAGRAVAWGEAFGLGASRLKFWELGFQGC